MLDLKAFANGPRPTVFSESFTEPGAHCLGWLTTGFKDPPACTSPELSPEVHTIHLAYYMCARGFY